MSNLEKQVPLYIITATYPRLEQLAELTRLGQVGRQFNPEANPKDLNGFPPSLSVQEIFFHTVTDHFILTHLEYESGLSKHQLHLRV